MSIGRFFELEFARSDPVHGIFLTGLELLDFVEVESFHLLAERLHLVTVSACFFDSDATHFEFFQASDLRLQIVGVARLALLLVLEHSLLQ